MAEYPSPSGRLHSFLGPFDGHEAAKPLTSDLKSPCGPPHWGQSSEAAPHRAAKLNKAVAQRNIPSTSGYLTLIARALPVKPARSRPPHDGHRTETGRKPDGKVLFHAITR